jgi:subtilisin family serine protease
MRKVTVALAGLSLLVSVVHTAPAGAAVVPNDPLFLNDQPGQPCYQVKNCVNQQWNLMSDGRGISADTAWETTKGKGAVVADIDTGINFDHADLKKQIWHNRGEMGTDSNGRSKRSNGIDDDHNGYVDDWRGWDFYENDNDPTDDAAYGHGTGTSGIAVARQNNGLGGTGVAPEARLMVLRAGDTFLVQADRLARAIMYAARNGADVITMSLGCIGASALLRDAVSYAERHGVVMAAAMANEFSVHPNSPAWLDPVVGVGAIVPDTDGTGSNTASDWTVKAGYSNYGAHIDVVSPSSIYTTLIGGGYGKFGGTSAATPGAAGVAALVMSRAKQLLLRLSSQEVTQILRMSADDLVGGPYDYAVGWDRFTGWGRVDAAKAVAMVEPSTIPPVADIDSPDWYQDLRGPVEVAGTVSARSGSYSWTLAVGQGVEPATFTQIAAGSGSDPYTGPLGTFDPTGQPDGLYTLVLDISDANGNHGQDRQAFVVNRDPSLMASFPLDLGTSLESSPQFADLNGDGKQELIVADADGRVHAFRQDGSELHGWPVRQLVLPNIPVKARAGFVSSPAVADLGNGGPDVIVGGLDGKVYAWDGGGRPVAGWPVETKVPPGPDPQHPQWEGTVLSSPAVGELDGNAQDGPEVVVGVGDGKVYAYHADGSALAGFPVLLQDPNQPQQAAKVVSSPAIGDIDGDGLNEIVIGSGESYGSTARVYALRADGSYQPGWPVTLKGFSTNITPVVGQGVPESPVLTDVDGDGILEAAISGVTTRFHLLQGNGTEKPGGSNYQGQYFSSGFGLNHDPAVTATDAVATVSGLAFGDLNRDGHPDLASGVTDTQLFAASQRPGQVIPFQHLVATWNTNHKGVMFNTFPRLVEDWMFLTTPIMADVDGDGTPELIAGNGAGSVHAFRADGSEPAGWPKYLGQWTLAAAAAGDLDGDGKTDVAVVTREGQVFVFSTAGVAGGLDWPNFRGTPANTGVFTEP